MFIHIKVEKMKSACDYKKNQKKKIKDFENILQAKSRILF